jgi:pimeloyl-ACP methyl ester carboxylesterase
MGGRSPARTAPLAPLLLLACAAPAAARGGPFDRPDPLAPPPMPPAEAVTIPADDAVEVAGTWWAAGDPDGPALVLVPMEGSTRSAWEPLVPALFEHRVAALAIDLRGPGSRRVASVKDPPPLPTFHTPEFHETMHRDVLAAIRFLVEKKGRDPRRIGVAGAGIGSAVALDAARRHGDRVHALMMVTPSLSYPGLPSEEHAKELPGAVHVILVAAVEDMDRGARRLLYTWERERNPPPLTPGLQREAKRRGVIPRIRALAQPGAFGTRVFGRVPFVEDWIAAWFARLWDTYPLPVLFEGSVDPKGDYGDPSWESGTELPAGLGVTGRALRWGRKVMVGAEVPESVAHARVRVALRRGGRQLDVGAIVSVPSGDVQASPITLRTAGAQRPSVPVEALALEGQEGYPGVAPVRPSFEVMVRFPEIEGEGPYEVRVSLAVETADEVEHGAPGIDPADPDTWPVVPDAFAR